MLLARWAVLRTGGSLVRPQAWLERPSPCAGGCSSQRGTGRLACVVCSVVAAGASLGGPSTYSVTSCRKRWWLVSRHFLFFRKPV